MIYLDKKDNDIIYYKNSQDFGLGFSYTLLESETAIFTQNKELRENLQSKGYSVSSLSCILGLPEDISLYKLFSYYFTGKIENDFDMIKALFEGFFSDRTICYCLKIGNTFCWFRYDENKFKKLGILQFSHKISLYSVGNFIKQLNFSMALTGVNLNSVKYIVWNKNDLSVEFEEYLSNCIYLSDIFMNVKGLKGLSMLDTFKTLSNEILFNPVVNAENFVNVLNQNFNALGFTMDLECRDLYLKDYSKLICNSIDFIDSKLFIIIDCEGKKGSDGNLYNGLSSLGGLICCKYKGHLISLETFNCDEILLNDTLKVVFHNYNQYKKTFRPIDIIVYGTSDKPMLLSSLKRSKYKLNFIDSKPYIDSYLSQNNILVDGRNSLSNIAKSLNVAPLFPKHNPVNDSRTLFNILYKIYSISNSFIV